MKRLLRDPPVSAHAGQVAAVLKHARSIEHFVTSATSSTDIADAIADPQLAGPKQLRALAMDVAQQLGAPMISATEAYEAHVRHNVLLQTGLPVLDDALGGGLAAGEVTEIIGPSGAGKSQLAFAMCAQQVATTEGRALFIDTSCGFRAERFYHMMGVAAPKMPRDRRKERLGAQLEVRRAMTLPALLMAVDALGAELDAGGLSGLRLVLIDSVYSALVAEHTNISRSAAGAHVARLQQALRRLAWHYHLAVVLVNSAVPVAKCDAAGRDQPPSQQQIVGGHEEFWRPSLGLQWLHTADVRLALRPDPAAPPDALATPHLLSIIKCPTAARKIAIADNCLALEVTAAGVTGAARDGGVAGSRSSLDFKAWG